MAAFLNTLVKIQIRQNSGNLIAQEIKASQEVPAFIMLDIY